MKKCLPDWVLLEQSGIVIVETADPIEETMAVYFITRRMGLEIPRVLRDSSWTSEAFRSYQDCREACLSTEPDVSRRPSAVTEQPLLYGLRCGWLISNNAFRVMT